MEQKLLAATPRQMAMILDSVALKGLTPAERKKVVAQLARLLLEASDTVDEGDNDEDL